MPIDVADAVLRPNQRANATRSLFIKPHVQHLVVVSFSSTLARLLIWLGVRIIKQAGLSHESSTLPP
jgi:hypothetical protein